MLSALGTHFQPQFKEHCAERAKTHHVGMNAGRAERHASIFDGDTASELLFFRPAQTIVQENLQFSGEIRKSRLALARSGVGCREPRSRKPLQIRIYR